MFVFEWYDVCTNHPTTLPILQNYNKCYTHVPTMYFVNTCSNQNNNNSDNH